MTTKVDEEISAVQNQITSLTTRLTALQAEKEIVDAAVAAATPKVKEAAVALHNLLCPLKHDGSSGKESCVWQLTPDYDDSTKADWSEETHALWLKRAQLGIQKLIDIGFTVTS